VISFSIKAAAKPGSWSLLAALPAQGNSWSATGMTDDAKAASKQSLVRRTKVLAQHKASFTAASDAEYHVCRSLPPGVVGFAAMHDPLAVQDVDNGMIAGGAAYRRTLGRRQPIETEDFLDQWPRGAALAKSGAIQQSQPASLSIEGTRLHR
jgi:hypothetical protein